MEKLVDSELHLNAESVYSEVLYSLIHNISYVDALSDASVQEIFDFVQNAFQFSDEQHQSILDAVKQQSPPDVSLELKVMEARNLKPQDIDGFSDPYCSVWISNNSQHMLNTSVQPKTLNPVWNEQLRFSITDVDKDKLQIVVWDFDPAENFKDKISHFGQVSSYRGLGKLLKEMAISSNVMSKPEPSPHDFIGLLNVPLNVIPLSGLESWFSLEGREVVKGKKSRGELKLGFTLLASRPETQFTFLDNFTLCEKLLSIIVEHEMQSDPYWCGQLPASASLTLHYLAAHRRLQPWMEDVCLWSVYSSALQKRNLDFHLVQNKLQNLCKVITENQIGGEEEQFMDIFWKASGKFVPAALESIRNVRNSYEIWRSSSQMTALLQCLRQLKTMDVESGRFIFADFISQLNEANMMGACDWWIKSVESRRDGDDISDEDRLIDTIKICNLINSDLEILSLHRETFLRELEISNFNLVYQHYDAQLYQLSKPIVDTINLVSAIHLSDDQIRLVSMEASIENPTEAIQSESHINEISNMGSKLLELYLALQHFQKLGDALSPSEKEKLELNDYNSWFLPNIKSWLVISKHKAMIRVGKAVGLDSLLTIDSLTKFSSSAVDTVTVFYQIKQFWEQLAWPDAEGAFTFIVKLIDDINQCASFYVDAISSKLARTCLQTPSTEVFRISPAVCTAINSVLHVRNSIEPLIEEMGLSKLCQSPQQETTRETLVKNAIDSMDTRLDKIFYAIEEKIEVEVDKLLMVVYESKFDEKQRQDLISYIDGVLMDLSHHLDVDTFEKNLHSIYQRIRHTFYQFITVDVQDRKKQQPSDYRQWDKLLDIINQLFYGTELENEIAHPVSDQIKRYLKLRGSESCDLIHQYQLERMKSDTQESKMGTLTVRALFVGNELVIEVLNARDLLPVDTNGYADPYVDIRLMPSSKFSDWRQKTQKKGKTLFPLFDETVTCAVPEELQTSDDYFIRFTVMDWDMIGANDFMGEAFLSFPKILRGDMTSAIADLDQIHLSLSKPSGFMYQCMEYLDILKTRSDKEAKHFVKKELVKMEEE